MTLIDKILLLVELPSHKINVLDTSPALHSAQKIALAIREATQGTCRGIHSRLGQVSWLEVALSHLVQVPEEH